MALERKKRSEIPTDAVILTESDALSYQRKLLDNWKVSSDVLGYKYGSFLLGLSSCLSGIYINNIFRAKFKLYTHGKIASYIPLAIVPGMVSVLLHHQFVLRNVILQKGNCPVCLEIRGAALQASLGFVMPMVLAPLSSISLAHAYATYNIPYITKEPLKVLSILASRIRPFKNTLFYIFVGQAVLGNFVTYLEFDSVWRVNKRLTELEKELVASGQ